MPVDTTSLVGKRFGNFLVLRFVGTSAKHSTEWECICLCGHVSVQPRSFLRIVSRPGRKELTCEKCRNGSSRRYEGDTRDAIEHRELTEIPEDARKFLGSERGQLLIVEYLETLDDGEYLYLCVCRCGSTIEATIEEIEGLSGVENDGSGSTCCLLQSQRRATPIDDRASEEVAESAERGCENRAA